jgi:hypothetical protein
VEQEPLTVATGSSAACDEPLIGDTAIELLKMVLESAGLALENLRLDLLKLRSSGVQAAIHDVLSATQEARALSREIGHVPEAVEEVRSS